MTTAIPGDVTPPVAEDDELYVIADGIQVIADGDVVIAGHVVDP